MTKELDYLLDKAKTIEMTPAQQERQRRSFAYGNTNIENSRITREMVDKAAEKLKKEKSSQ